MKPYGWIILAAFVAIELVALVGDLTPWDVTPFGVFFVSVAVVFVIMRNRERHR